MKIDDAVCVGDGPGHSGIATLEKFLAVEDRVTVEIRVRAEAEERVLEIGEEVARDVVFALAGATGGQIRQ